MCVPHQTGGVDPPSRERSGERPGESTERGADEVVDGARGAGELARLRPVVLGDVFVHPVDGRLVVAGQASSPV